MVAVHDTFLSRAKERSVQRWSVSHLIQILIVVAGIAVILTRLIGIELESRHISWDSTALTFAPPSLEAYVVPYSDILSMEITELSDYGSWVRGMDTDHTRYGLWHNDLYGDYHLYMQKSIPVCIVLETRDGYTVFNLESEDVTRQLYAQIAEHTAAE